MEENKNKGFWRGFICVILLSLAVAAAAGVFVFGGMLLKLGKTGHRASEEDYPMVSSDEKVLRKLGLLETYLRAYSLDEPDDELMEEYLYRGLMVGSGDIYAEYYTQEEYVSMTDSKDGSFCGIGAVFSQDLTSGEITVTMVYEGTPAEAGGLKAGDILYLVDDQDISEYELSYITTNLIKGDEGTEVKLTVYRNGKETELKMIRGIVEIPTVTSEMLEGGIGYIRITTFDDITSTQFLKAAEELQAENMTSLILDLRNNGGGRVVPAVKIADALLPEGVIYYTEYSDGTRREETSDAEYLGLPMVVLMNEYSASASEILAGALKDYQAATIVGTQSYGKGVVQSVFELDDGTAIRLTTARYYTPSGTNIHGVGIEPDVEIEMPEELLLQNSITKEEDVQLQKAKEVLQQ
ncbi:MAG: S41 family peptidase [Lachnospiraceae bacterium]